jgi:DUF1009 family protein
MKVEAILGNVAPSEKDWIDIEHTKEVADELRLAMPEAANTVVQHGLVLGVEAEVREYPVQFLRRCAKVMRKPPEGVFLCYDPLSSEIIKEAATIGLKGIALYNAPSSDLWKEANHAGLFIVLLSEEGAIDE